MVLLAKHRMTIYERLSPVIGEEEAGALMAEFPSREDEEPITKHYLAAQLATSTGTLRAEMKDMRTELKEDIAGLRTELKGDIAGLRTELKGDIAGLRTEAKSDVAELRNEMKDLRIDLRGDINRMAVWVTSACVGSVVAAATVVAAIS